MVHVTTLLLLGPVFHLLHAALLVAVVLVATHSNLTNSIIGTLYVFMFSLYTFMHTLILYTEVHTSTCTRIAHMYTHQPYISGKQSQIDVGYDDCLLLQCGTVTFFFLTFNTFLPMRQWIRIPGITVQATTCRRLYG